MKKPKKKEASPAHKNQTRLPGETDGAARLASLNPPFPTHWGDLRKLFYWLVPGILDHRLGDVGHPINDRVVGD